MASGMADTSGKTKASRNSERLRLDSRQQAALVKAQAAANDLVAALKNGADWQTPLAEYEKVAVAPARLDNFLNALSPEPDWKSILAKLAHTLEHCGGELPVPARNALREVQKLLGCKTDQPPVPSGKPQAAVANGNPAQKDRKDDSPRCAGPAEEVLTEDVRQPPAQIEATDCLPVRGPEEVPKHGAPDAAPVQGSAPAAKGRETAPPEKSAAYRLRKAKAQREYYRRKKQAQRAVRAATPAAPQDAGPLGVTREDEPQSAAAPAQKHGGTEKSRKPISSPKLTVCSPVLSAEQDERKHGTFDAASGHPASRQGDFVRNEVCKWEFAPEEQQAGDMTHIRIVQPGDLPHSKGLNTSPVASIVPRHINPQPTAQSAA